MIFKPKPDPTADVREELNAIKKLCAKHELLCCAFAKWRDDIDQNEAQLEILNSSASSLRQRHRALSERLADKPADPALLLSIQKEIRSIERQVDTWIREIAAISDARTKLDIEFVQLRGKLQRSVTNIEIANIDFEKLERNHRDKWKSFLSSAEVHS
ncbi:hypothetical protein QR680_013004 [Steinernema hermaphroditum]|uniref:Uncharacterized protein n=1 Tax=Steinernema hermaphroditum TaxID=289476 RepID=A0AA39I429_9BILA|nr:hypothetical protein QR680_013004 [Steinernema hermaphroditum]